MKSLKAFLAAEETKDPHHQWSFQTEEKFQNSEQIWPKCVMLVNSNDWDAHFAYDLDPGIIDRIKILSTYREYEVKQNRYKLDGCKLLKALLTFVQGLTFLFWLISLGLAAMLFICGAFVSPLIGSTRSLLTQPIQLSIAYNMRYGTGLPDRESVSKRIRARHWSTQWRLQQRLETTDEPYFMPELTPEVLTRHLKDLLFLGLDKSATSLMDTMKEDWNSVGRPGTHYYQGLPRDPVGVSPTCDQCDAR